MKVNYLISTSVILIAALFTGCGDLGLNRTIQIAAGEKHKGDLNSVNGAIIIGRNCEIIGSCRTVNGGIEVKESATVEDLMAVNGSISLAEKVRVLGEVNTVNGSIDCRQGVTVKKEVSTINGNINLNNTTVKYDVSTINGDIALHNKSIVEGDIVIRPRHGFSHANPALDISISDSSVVAGDIINRDKDRTVNVILSGGGQVKGRLQDVQITRQ
jgi:hypothetical protein